jgi:hypothetical protein
MRKVLIGLSSLIGLYVIFLVITFFISPLKLFGLFPFNILPLSVRTTETTIKNGVVTNIKGGGSVDRLSGKISYKLGDDTVETGNVSLPSDFPKDIPIYPNSKLYYKSASPSSKSIALSTGDDMNTVKKYYKEEMKNLGWVYVPTFLDQADEKTQSYSLMFPLQFEKDKRRITITLSKSKSVNLSITIDYITDY